MSPSLLDRRQRNVTGAGLFLLLSLALLGVGARMGSLAQHAPAPPLRLEHHRGEFKQPPFFTLLDRDGRALARSLPTYAIEASPYNLWLGHTPERIVAGLAAALELDADGAAALTDTLLGLDAAGDVVVDRWPLTRDEAVALSKWIASGGPGEGQALPGFRLESLELDEEHRALLAAAGAGPWFNLVWRPQVALSQSTRERLVPGLVDRGGAAAHWVRSLAKGIAPFFEGARERELALLRARGQIEPPRFHLLAADLAPSRGLAAELRAMIVGARQPRDPDEWVFIGPPHEWVFDGLMPRRHVEVADVLPIERLGAIRALIAEEQLSEYQLWLQPTSERVYPLGESGIVGTWEWLPSVEPVPEGAEPETVLRPSRGLEHFGYSVLRALERARAGDGGAREVPLVEGGPSLRPDHLVAGAGDGFERLMLRPRRPGHPRDYYVARSEGVAPAELESTLDLDLERTVGLRLERLVAEHDAALAMAVAIELDSREVLAVDWRSKYGAITFPPLQHGFTPGSTFKLVTMALALQERLVRPEETLDVGQGAFRVEPPAGRRGRARVIREAEGYARGVVTAATCVARSSNAGMVQIGLRVPVAVWKRATADLGYGEPACPELLAPGLLNLAGRVGESDTRGGDPWERRRSHASVSFGDSITTNLLQHASALCALLDDGAWRPLRFARAVVADGERHALVDERRRQVVRPDVVRDLRAMMAEGARTGTCKDLARPAGLVLRTKTGTTEKLAFDVCEHKYRAEHARALERGEVWDDAAARRRLRGDFAPRATCYAPSIAVLAAHPVTGREVLVFLFVDDPHGEEKFGSKVAGPAAVDILCAALDIDPPGAPAAREPVAPPVLVEPGADLPWEPSARARPGPTEVASW